MPNYKLDRSFAATLSPAERKKAEAWIRPKVKLSIKKKAKQGKAKTPKWVKQYRAGLLAKKNEAETCTEDMLQSMGIPYQRELAVKVFKSRYFVDFYIPSIRINDKNVRVNIALEIDGGYHLSKVQFIKDRGKERDLLKTRRIDQVVRVSAKNIMTMEGSEFFEILTQQYQRNSVEIIY